MIINNVNNLQYKSLVNRDIKNFTQHEAALIIQSKWRWFRGRPDYNIIIKRNLLFSLHYKNNQIINLESTLNYKNKIIDDLNALLKDKIKIINKLQYYQKINDLNGLLKNNLQNDQKKINDDIVMTDDDYS